jgi:hypothetical protein
MGESRGDKVRIWTDVPLQIIHITHSLNTFSVKKKIIDIVSIK